VFRRKRTPESLTQLLRETQSLPCREDLEDWVKQFEKDGQFTEKEILNAFRLYDEDGSGTISRDELKNVIELIGESMDDSEMEELVREADVNGDGNINYQEFVNMVLLEKF
jgi:Ca2+-binding EF-hand superfamily protein